MDSLIADGSGGQSLADIESYLVSFNKEIADQAEGTYMLSSGMDGTSTANSQSPVYTELGTAVYPVSADAKSISQGIHRNNVEQLYNGVSGEDEGVQLMDGATGTELSMEGDYQTVTLVPSTNAQGEVSYMLIVPQDELASGQKDLSNGRADMSVFDFKEEAAASKRWVDNGGGGDMGEGELVEEDEDTVDVKIKTSFSNTSCIKRSVVRSGDQLMCNYCNYTSSKRFLLSRHMKTHSEERPHKCDICGRAFKTTVSLTNHINTHKRIKPNKCKECDAAFTTSGELIRHVRYIHTFEKPHKCSECDYASVELSKLKRHIRSHTGERPYQCPHCLYASPDTFKLKRHLRVHSGEKPYVCDICDMRFTQSNSLKSHKLIHTGQKPVFQCELCPTTCGRKTDLKNHVLKIHTSDKPLLCKKCGKSFPDRYTYRIHQRTHDGQKCFRCELCPYSAHLQRQLESHILTHTGERPYKCHRCDTAFRQKQLLKRHINVYHNPTYTPTTPRSKSHPCTECNKSFALRGNLLRHLALHFPDNEEYQAALASEGEGEEGVYNMAEGEEGAENLYGNEFINMTGGNDPIHVQLMPESSSAAAAADVEGSVDDSSQRVYLELGSCNTLIHSTADQQLLHSTVDTQQLQQLEEEGFGENDFSLMDGEEEEPVARKKRGRPSVWTSRSQKKSSANDDDDEDYSPSVTPRRRGRPKSTKVTPSPATPKTPRGRKPKQQKSNESLHSEEVEEETDGKAEEELGTYIKQEGDSTRKKSRRSIKSPKFLIDD